MPKILMLCKAYPPVVGGVESFSEQVSRAYLRRGDQVTVITQTNGDKGWAAKEFPDGRLSVYNTGPGNQLATAVKMLIAVLLATWNQRFDLFHATTWRPAIALAWARHRAPLVISVHGREVLAIPKFLRPVMGLVLRRATLVVAVSAATRRRAEQRLRATVDVKDWVVAGNGLSFLSAEKPSAVGPSNERRVRILTLARLVERKNIQGCVAALAALKGSGYENFEYRVAGKGPLLEALKRQVQDAGLNEFVEFLGYVVPEDVPSLYEWADVFLHPQVDLDGGEDFEGFGLAIADAMSFGCLAIAGDGSGPSDFIENGKTGVLVDGSSQADLQRAIRGVLDDRPAFDAVANAGRDFVLAELSWDKHVSLVMENLNARRLTGPDESGPTFDCSS